MATENQDNDINLFDEFEEEALYEMHKDIIDMSDFLAASPGSCGAPSRCGRYANTCNSRCQCKC